MLSRFVCPCRAVRSGRILVPTMPTRDSHSEKAVPPRKRKGQFAKGDPRINRTKPGPGRPKNSLKRWMRKQLKHKATKRSVRKILKNPNSPAFNSVYSTLLAYSVPKPAAKLEHGGKVTLEQLLAKSREVEDE